VEGGHISRLRWRRGWLYILHVVHAASWNQRGNSFFSIRRGDVKAYGLFGCCPASPSRCARVSGRSISFHNGWPPVLATATANFRLCGHVHHALQLTPAALNYAHNYSYSNQAHQLSFPELASCYLGTSLQVARTWPKTWRRKVNGLPRQIVVLGETDLSRLVTYRRHHFRARFGLGGCKNFSSLLLRRLCLNTKCKWNEYLFFEQNDLFRCAEVKC